MPPQCEEFVTGEFCTAALPLISERPTGTEGFSLAYVALYQKSEKPNGRSYHKSSEYSASTGVRWRFPIPFGRHLVIIVTRAVGVPVLSVSALSKACLHDL